MTEAATLLPTDAVLAADGEPPQRVPLGRTRGGRPLYGHRLGSGPLRVSLIAGCHADEPVGPALLDRLVAFLSSPAGAPARTAASFWVVPHANPDGEEENRSWVGVTVPVRDHRGEPDQAYEPASYLARVRRELPGDDLEFGFPRSADDRLARPENRAIAGFLAEGAPLHLHASLHGMAFARGPWFLLEPAWRSRLAVLQATLAAAVAAMGYQLHDVDRRGEKGFVRIAPGFCTRPDSLAMAAHFRARGDEATAALFRPSSMEHVRSLGGDPLTLVSEMPLFLCDREAPEDRPDPEDPSTRAAFVVWLREALAAGRPTGVRPMALRDQMRLQVALLESGLAAAGAAVLAAPARDR